LLTSKSCTQSVCVSLSLSNHYEKRMCNVILSYFLCLAVPYFSILSHKRNDSQKRICWT